MCIRDSFPPAAAGGLLQLVDAGQAAERDQRVLEQRRTDQRIVRLRIRPRISRARRRHGPTLHDYWAWPNSSPPPSSSSSSSSPQSPPLSSSSSSSPLASSSSPTSPSSS